MVIGKKPAPLQLLISLTIIRNKCTEHLGMSDMKTMMKYLTAASFIVVAPFVNADDHSGTEMQTAKESQVQMTKKARHSANGLPVKQLLLRAQTSQACRR